ncbi:MAG: hypothetical protein A2147_03590 [Chloroflexi bacterium RBG_16_57_8]|nr:MAG: hypothetical protein A2147_03590 [Chloroflexi bacterium RBG_16_57_8]
MHIRWSALKVSEAMDKLDELVSEATKPLEKARIAAREARGIPSLPQYVDQRLLSIIAEIDHIIGGGQYQTTGKLKLSIESIRESLPQAAVKDEKKLRESGDQLMLAG